MEDETSQQNQNGSLSRERVVSSALKQAARHEHAAWACLAELGGYDAPKSDLTEQTRRRAARHADRAISLTRTAIRMNRDPLAEAFLAALLERHERTALLVEQGDTPIETTAFSLAG
jgi:hypothetical protein